MVLCRLCYLEISGQLFKNIFDEKFDPPIWKIVYELANLTIVENDPYTKIVCIDCFDQLLKFNGFRKTIIENDRKFKDTSLEMSFNEICNNINGNCPTIKMEIEDEDYDLTNETVDVKEYHVNFEKIRKRKIRASKQQIEVLMNFVTKNQTMIPTHQCNARSDDFEHKWEKLTAMLNNMDGAEKNKEQWKRLYVTHKSKVKAKARKEYLAMKQTGGDELSDEDPLDNAEKDIFDICSNSELYGDDSLKDVNLLQHMRVPNVVDIERSSEIPSTSANLSAINEPTAEIDNNKRFFEFPPKSPQSVLISNNTTPRIKRKFINQRKAKRRRRIIRRDNLKAYCESHKQLSESITLLANCVIKLTEAITNQTENKKIF